MGGQNDPPLDLRKQSAPKDKTESKSKKKRAETRGRTVKLSKTRGARRKTRDIVYPDRSKEVGEMARGEHPRVSSVPSPLE